MARHPSGPRLDTSPAGYFEVRWTEDGRSRRLTTGTKDPVAAQQFLAAWMFKAGAAALSAPTAALVLDTYLDEREKDAESREGIAAAHLKGFFGAMAIDTITADKQRAYRRARGKAKRPAAPVTVRRELAVLIAAINHAVRQRRVSPAMVPVIDLPAEGVPRTAHFTAAQVDALIALTAPAEGQRMSRLHRFLWLASETASRRHAIEALTWAKVNMATGLIDFRVAGQHAKKRRVAVPISDRLRPVLEQMKAEHRSPFVLDEPDSIYSAWVALMKRAARLTGDESYLGMVPHDLRRTWATNAAAAGVSMWDIAGVLGDSLNVVTKHYAHHSPDRLRDAINRRAV